MFPAILAAFGCGGFSPRTPDSAADEVEQRTRLIEGGSLISCQNLELRLLGRLRVAEDGRCDVTDTEFGLPLFEQFGELHGDDGRQHVDETGTRTR